MSEFGSYIGPTSEDLDTDIVAEMRRRVSHNQRARLLVDTILTKGFMSTVEPSNAGYEHPPRAARCPRARHSSRLLRQSRSQRVHARPGRRDPRLLLGEGAHRARPAGAPPAALCPHQTHRAPERRQIRQAHLAGAVTVNPAAAAPTARTANEADTDLKGPPGRSTTPVTATPAPKPTTTCNARIASTTTGILQNSEARTPPILGDPSQPGPDPQHVIPRSKTKRH